MKEVIWLNIGCEVIIDPLNVRKKILITNPSAVKKEQIHDVWERLIKTLGKHEFEYWLAEEIVIRCEDAVDSGNHFADISDISGATFYLGDEDEEKMMIAISNKSFQKILIDLPIFRMVEETDKKILLEIVPF